MPGFPVHHQLLNLAQTRVHQVGDAIEPTQPRSSSSPPAFNLSSIRVFSNELILPIRWPKYWSFSFSISPSSEYSGLICFRADWFVFLAVQRTLESLQHHSWKASILQRSDEACLCYRNKICSQDYVFSTLLCCHIGNCLLI